MKSKKGYKLFFFLNFILLFLLLVSFGINQILIEKINKNLGIKNEFSQLTNIFGRSGNLDKSIAQTGDVLQKAINLVVSSGVPKTYGAELGVSFDKVQSSMNIMKQYDPTYGKKKIVLTGSDKQRYIDIGMEIACEYCCDAKTLVFKDGRAACGCAHSQSMRGLEAYLIKNHGTKYSNDQILKELARWKGMFFPKQMIKKMTAQLQSGNYNTPDTASLINKLHTK